MDEVQLFQDAFFYWMLFEGTEAVWSSAATAYSASLMTTISMT
jgi:hypothetical protein